MAQIILEPGEVFEHFHAEVSRTQLLEGSIRFTMNQREVPMQTLQTVEVPAHIPHVIENTGQIPAVVLCYHGVEEE